MDSSLLRQFIAQVLSEVQDYRVPNQLVPKNAKTKRHAEKDSEEKSGSEEEKEVDEESVTANIVGFTGPVGVSSADMGANPTKPGQKLKANKKKFVRWK
jgi:hypothetical protein